jgi:tyrosine-protein kinase Etk/Wzc
MTNYNNQNTLPSTVITTPQLQNNLLPHSPVVVPSEDSVQLATIFDTFVQHQWMILKFTLLALLVGIVIAFSKKPIFESTMLIHVEDDKPNTSKNMLGDISSLFDVKAAAISEMEILNSRLVVARAVDHLGLYIDVHPRYFPIIGSWIASKNAELSEPGLFGFGGYAWGQENIDVSTFYAPETLQNKRFVITVKTENQFLLQQEEEKIELTGKIGTKLSETLNQGKIELLIGKINAKPGTQFHLKYIPKVQAIEAIQSALTVAEKGKQSGIISVTLEGTDAKLVNDTLVEIGREYVNQNVQRKLEEAEKSLVFLDKQLPDLKQNLEQSEARYYEFRNSHGTIDLAEEAKLALQHGMIEKAKRLELQQKREELLISFTPSHPLVVGIDKQIQKMNSEINTRTAQIKELPFLEGKLLRLNRDMKVNAELYAALLNSAQQLRLMKAGKVSNVRLIDAPMLTDQPARPNRAKIIGISALLGLFLGIAIAFLRKAFQSGIENPQKIEHILGARVVYATIPHSQLQAKLGDKSIPRSQALPILATADPQDIAIESLRSFRTALLFSMPQARNNIFLLSSPTRDLGKSFISVNFAAVMASSGKRVLLIDADFREGHLHRYFNKERRNGLSETIANLSILKQAIHHNVLPNLDFLSTGKLPPNPSEYLLHPNFGSILQILSSEYDFIFLDPPPVLAVSDALTIGSHAGTVFMLVRADVTTENEILESIKRLSHAGISPQGVVFNDLKLRAHQVAKYGYSSINKAEEPSISIANYLHVK